MDHGVPHMGECTGIPTPLLSRSRKACHLKNMVYLVSPPTPFPFRQTRARALEGFMEDLDHVQAKFLPLVKRCSPYKVLRTHERAVALSQEVRFFST